MFRILFTKPNGMKPMVMAAVVGTQILDRPLSPQSYFVLYVAGLSLYGLDRYKIFLHLCQTFYFLLFLL